MEWVETTGRTVDDAKEAALDQLGVDERDAEFEVVDEPRTGLFGRMRGEARVRARVRPVAPRPKADRRRRRPEGSGRSGGGTKGKDDRADASSDGSKAGPTGGTAAAGGSSGRSRSRRPRSTRAAGDGATTSTTTANGEPVDTSNDVTVEEQAALMRTFLDGLMGAFDLEATITEDKVDDENVELRVEGEDLGLLIGPKGQTLQSIQELARTVVQRHASGTHHGRVRIDVAGYRQRRREALERFARQVAADVVASGSARALEPMHPADRKVVHDVVNELDGVATTSEGEEPRRRVVILPAETATSAAAAESS